MYCNTDIYTEIQKKQDLQQNGHYALYTVFPVDEQCIIKPWA